MTPLLFDWKISYVATQTELMTVVSKAIETNLITLDTETAGWKTGNEYLCLIQLGLPETKESVIIDVLSCGEISSLAPLLLSSKVTKVVHNAEFERRQFNRHQIKLHEVVDTLTLSRELRPDLPNHTLKSCAKYIVGFDMSKVEQESDWSIRPLRNEQLEYAAIDVYATYHVYMALAKMQEQLIIGENTTVPELMRDLQATIGQRWALISDLAAELAISTAREERIKVAIKERLSAGASPYDGEFGNCSIKKIKNTEIDPELVRQLMPSIASLAIREEVQRKRLEALAKEHGIGKELIEAVTRIVGYTDRLSVHVKT